MQHTFSNLNQQDSTLTLKQITEKQMKESFFFFFLDCTSAEHFQGKERFHLHSGRSCIRFNYYILTWSMRHQFQWEVRVQGIAFTWSRKQTLLRLEINVFKSVHFIFTIQNHPLATRSHAVHKIFELQRLFPVHKALAKAFWMILFRLCSCTDT